MLIRIAAYIDIYNQLILWIILAVICSHGYVNVVVNNVVRSALFENIFNCTRLLRIM